MSGVVKGIGKAVGGAAKGAFKGVQKLGGAASKLAPLVGLVPGLGTVAGGALGLGGGLLSGQGFGKSLKRGLAGAGGAFGLGKLGGAKGIASGLAKLFKGGGQGGGAQQGGAGQQFMQSLLNQQQGGGGIGGFLSKLFGGGGLGKLAGAGLGAASLIGAGKQRKGQQEFLDQILQQQQFGLGTEQNPTGGLAGAEQSFAARAPLRQQAFSRLQQGLSRAPKGIFGR